MILISYPRANMTNYGKKLNFFDDAFLTLPIRQGKTAIQTG